MNEKKKVNWIQLILDVVKVLSGALLGTQL